MDSPVDQVSNGNKPRVLVIDSDPGIRRLLHSVLSNSRYGSAETPDLEQSRAIVDRIRPDLILIGAETSAQFEAITWAKEKFGVPVIVLSGLKNQMVLALDAGADDYVEKPFHVPELLARVRVALRHAAQIAPGQTSLHLGNVKVDLERRLVTRDNIPVRLTRREYELLSYLARRVGQILTCEQIMRDIWGTRKAGTVNALREYISLLRKKLEPDPGHPQHILTEPTGGYRLWADDQSGLPVQPSTPSLRNLDAP